MTWEQDEFYLKYVMARFSAFRNVWWSHGGKLHGDSPARIAFLRKIVEETPGDGLMPVKRDWDAPCAAVEHMQDDGSYYLFYYGFNRPTARHFRFDNGFAYRVQVIDTWDMTITEAGTFEGSFTVPLPGMEYMAIRLIKAGE